MAAMVDPAASSSPEGSLHSSAPPLHAPDNSPWSKRSPAANSSVSVHVASGVARAKIPDDVIIDSQPLWSHCIAGHFIDEPPSIAKLHATVNRLWRTKKQTEFLDVQFLNSTTAIIRIPNKKSRDWVLEKRVWHIGTTPMLVQQWSPTNARAPPDMTRIPVWVDFMGVPDALFAEEGLKFLGDIVGKYIGLEHYETTNCGDVCVCSVSKENSLSCLSSCRIKVLEIGAIKEVQKR